MSSPWSVAMVRRRRSRAGAGGSSSSPGRSWPRASRTPRSTGTTGSSPSTRSAATPRRSVRRRVPRLARVGAATAGRRIACSATIDPRHQAERGRAGPHRPAVGDPRRWARGGRVAGWRPRHRRRTGRLARPATEYLIYQTLVGAWPLSASGRSGYAMKATGGQGPHVLDGPGPDVRRRRSHAFAARRPRRRRASSPSSTRSSAPLVEPGRVIVAGADALQAHGPGCPGHLPGQRALGPVRWSTPTTGARSTTAAGRRPQRRRRRPPRAAARSAPRCRRAAGDARRRSLWARPTSPLAVSDGHAGRASSRRADVVTVVPRLVIAARSPVSGTTVGLPAGRWRDVVTGAVVDGGCVEVDELLHASRSRSSRRDDPRAGRPSGDVSLVLDTELPMAARDGGWWEDTDQRPPGTRYRLRVDGGPVVPDPRSAWQPDGVDGPSRRSTTQRSPGPTRRGTAGATCRRPWSTSSTSARSPPPARSTASQSTSTTCVDLGVTHVELMPVAEFPGGRGWGYDGVLLYAPHHAYGGPDGSEAARRRLPRARAWPSSSTSSTTTSARRATTSPRSGPTSPTGTPRRGATRSTSTGAGATRCGASSSTTP